MDKNTISSNKRTASDISHDSDSHSVQSDHVSDTELQPSIINNNTVFSHHIKQTFLGPICTSCKRKVVRGHTLFYVSRHSLKSHITTNNCFSGNLPSFKSQTLEKSLHIALVQYHNSMRKDPALASRIVHNKYHFQNSPKNLPYCNQCGFIGSKLCHVRRHVQLTSNLCTESDVRTADGSILSNEYGFLIPRSVLDNISRGRFSLPTKPTQLPTHPPVPQPHHSLPPSTSPPPPTHSPNPAATSLHESTTYSSLTRFLPTEEEVMTSLASSSSNDATTMNSFIVSELCNTFGSQEKANVAYDYLTAFILLINQQIPGLLKQQLTDYTTMLTPNSLDTNLQLLLHAGKQWFDTQSANVDVRIVPVHHRNAIYLIGNTFLESDRDLLKGNTFVWSNKTDTINDQFRGLITFAHQINWPQLTPYMSRISDVYSIAVEDPTCDTEEEFDVASRKLINTSIIFGLLTEILLEDPPTPNGPNLIYQYLAAMSVRKTHNCDIALRNHNEISKHANALLRLLRHGVCSFYVRQSQLMAEKKESHKTFEVWANKLIQDIQVCPSIGHICRTIRTAREVDRKTPSKIQKAFNDRTGELLVDGIQIHKSTWSVAIPTAIREWDKFLIPLFPQHSASSNLPLHWIFDVDNEIVLAGSDSFLSINGSLDNIIPLTEFIPFLPR